VSQQQHLDIKQTPALETGTGWSLRSGGRGDEAQGDAPCSTCWAGKQPRAPSPG